jgi:hypothetical protein
MNKAIVRFAVLALFLVAVPVTAQQGWTSTGSTGTVDETSLGIYATNLASIGFTAGPTGSIQARYNVTNAFGGGFTDTPPWNTLEMTYFDSSPSSGLSATLFQVNRCTGAVTSLCTVSSVDATTNTCRACTFPAGAINFAGNIYWVELRMSRSVNTVNPQLIALRIF